MNKEYDVCVIGSGAGGGPVALALSEAGYQVLVLEKGPWFTEKDFFKDELASSQRDAYKPSLKDEKHVIEDYQDDSDKKNNKWVASSTEKGGQNFWNGNCVGGSSNFMSGFFWRLKPVDFKLLSEFGPIKGANIADWPISYNDLEPYYAKAEVEVGISGKVIKHPNAEPRSTKDFPYPPTHEHFFSATFDKVCTKMKLHPVPMPRAVLSKPSGKRRSCEYSGYCAYYGCSTGAKGSSRAALLGRATDNGRCTILANSKVHKLVSDNSGKVVAAEYFDKAGKKQKAIAKIFVVACQAIETSRLLLFSKGPKHKQGLGNNSGQLGQNLLFAGSASGTGDFLYKNYTTAEVNKIKQMGPFLNRGLQDWYVINDKKLGGRIKGGTIDFVISHPNGIERALLYKTDNDDKLMWGAELKKNLVEEFRHAQYVTFEVFCDWLPNDNCFVSLDKKVKDKWGDPVSKVRIGHHEHDVDVAKYLAKHGVQVLEKMGAINLRFHASGAPPVNLVAGGCRFGKDPKTSVLNPDCQVHDAENLYVTDGSFMPTGGSVPYTWTIYANSFRVADRIIERLGGNNPGSKKRPV